MATKTKTISFTDEYMHIKEYLDGLDNASRYLCRLVQKDIDESSMPLSELVRSIVSEQLKDYSLSSNTTTLPNNNNNYIKSCVADLF